MNTEYMNAGKDKNKAKRAQFYACKTVNKWYGILNSGDILGSCKYG